MDKALTIKIEETKKALVGVINNSGLHSYILDTIVRDIHNEIHALYQRQYEEDVKQYQIALAQAQKEQEEQKETEVVEGVVE